MAFTQKAQSNRRAKHVRAVIKQTGRKLCVSWHQKIAPLPATHAGGAVEG